MLINNKLKALAFLIVPFLLAVVDFFFLKAAFPLHSGSPGYDQDPAYAYLFNGLLILEGYPPHHIDHPGTPLQLLFALTIFIRWGLTRVFGESTLDIVDSVIDNPEAYLHDLAVLLLVLNLAALTFFGRRIAQATGKVYLGMFCQLSLLSFTIMAPKATYPAPEALLIFCSLILLGLLSPRIFALQYPQNIGSTVSSKMVGATFALGMAIKITFVPMALLLILLQKGKERRVGIVTSIFVFLLLTCPALPNADRFFTWVTGLLSNSGIHGGGGAGFINLAKVPNNLYNLFVWFPLFLPALTLAIYAVLTTSIRYPTTSIRGPLVLLSVALVQTGLVLKHPGAHYMIAVLPMALVLLAWVVLTAYREQLVVKLLLVTVIGIGLLHSVSLTIVGVKKLADQRAQMSIALSEINRELALHPDALIICSYRCALPQYALTMAFIFAPQLISKKTTEKLNKFYDYDIFQSQLIAVGLPPKDWKNMDEYIADGGVIILVTPKIYPQLRDLKLRPLFAIPNSLQNAYFYLHSQKNNNY